MRAKSDLKTSVSTEDTNHIVVQFFGPLDETSLSVLPPLPDNCDIFDLSKLTRVSSSGAEMWIQWLRSQNGDSRKITARCLCPNFVRILNSLDAMLPFHWEIESFYVPHVGDGIVENILFIKDKHFTKREIYLSPLTSSPVDGRKLELDVDPERYFLFLKHRFPEIKVNQVMASI